MVPLRHVVREERRDRPDDEEREQCMVHTALAEQEPWTYDAPDDRLRARDLRIWTNKANMRLSHKTLQRYGTAGEETYPAG